MYLIRPISLDDLPALLELAQQTGFGLTTLPCDEKLLRRRIKDSLRGFEELSDGDAPMGETYLFVLEKAPTGTVCGTCGIVSKVGGFEPFYAYRIETSVHASQILNIRKEIQTLHLVEQHSGPCEIGSLFLSPAHRKPGVGRLLSLSRFLFMADHLSFFDPVVIAEMRGVSDATGHSPFWEALGRHFFEVDFPKADYLSMVNKRFIADLMPKHPIYIPLLPKDAQAVIGEVHEHSRPALRILQDEGFARSGMVDIFEAGPIVQCNLEDIRTVRESQRAVVDGVAAAPADAKTFLVSNGRADFRATLAPLVLDEAGRVRMTGETAEALRVKAGESIRYISSRPATAARYHDAMVSFD